MMKKLLVVLLTGFIVLSSFGQDNNINFENLIKKCNGFNSDDFKSKPYIELASYIQSIEKEEAILVLKEFANTGKFEDQIIVLTKMLFVSKKDSILRRPFVGAAGFLGNTSYDDWAGEPIEIIDGIPFLITRGYSLGGCPESSLLYLEYCIENGEWTSIIYKTKTDEELKKALSLLLACEKWKIELNEIDTEFLKKQIR